VLRQIASVTLPGEGSNEDRCGIRNHLAWVIDGATPLSENRIAPDYPTDAVWMVERLTDGILRRAKSSTSLADLLADVIAEVALAARNEWVETPEIPPSAAVGIIRMGTETMEYLVLADISVVYQEDEKVIEITDERPDELNFLAASKLRNLLEEGVPHSDAMIQVRPLLLRHRRESMNVNGGYWVAALDPEAASHALVGEVPRPPQILIASDGFARGPKLFELWDWSVPLNNPNSLEALAAEIRAAELKDEGCRNFPRWNVIDDLIVQIVESAE
jgi:hypothetical protein